MVQTWWQKLNANERMAATGAVIVFVVSLLGFGWLALIGSAAVLAVYWLKYQPNQSMNWPAPVELITLVISAIIGISALMGLLALITFSGFGLGFLGFYGGGLFGGVYLLALASVIALAIGAGMMVLGTWREYQVTPRTTGTPPASSSAPPPPPANEPPSAPSGTPPSAPPGTPPSEPPAGTPGASSGA
jgi:hypothetical protein